AAGYRRRTTVPQASVFGRSGIIDPKFAESLFGSMAKQWSLLGESVIKGSGIIDTAISTGVALGRSNLLSSGIGDALRLTASASSLTGVTNPLAGMVPQTTLNALSGITGLTPVQSLFPDGVWGSWLPDLRFLDDFARYLPSIEQVERLDLPENLQDPAVLLDYDQWELWMQEGIPIAYVLDVDTIDRLEAVGTVQERRRVISRRRGQITDLCAGLLNDITATAMLPYVDTARMALAGLADGHYQLAQTWAAANLETLIQQFHGDDWKRVPLSYNRHAWVQFTTTRRQFSKLNATLAIGHLVSAICNHDAAARQLAHRD
ncbi:MAG: hypothetical protein V4737_12385, partial [Curtobacterium sp.]